MTKENQMDDLMLPEPSYKQKWQSTDGNKWISGVTNYYTADQLREYAKKAVEAEREACAKLCEDAVTQHQFHSNFVCANAIRARASD